MSTVTATGWNGLMHGSSSNGGLGLDPSVLYTTVGEIIPKGGKVGRLMQKRGLYSLSSAVTGAVTQLSRAVIDHQAADINARGSVVWNDGTEGDPSDATGVGAHTPMPITNAQGSPEVGQRTIPLVNTVPTTDAEGLSQAFDTTITHAYPVDSSLNGGPAMAANPPNAAQP